MLRLPKTKAEALRVLKQRGMLPKWSYLCVMAALKDWKKYG